MNQKTALKRCVTVCMKGFCRMLTGNTYEMFCHPQNLSIASLSMGGWWWRCLSQRHRKYFDTFRSRYASSQPVVA